MSKWEFMSIELMHGSRKDDDRLAELGGIGWELVAVVPFGSLHVAYLKRPLMPLSGPGLMKQLQAIDG